MIKVCVIMGEEDWAEARTEKNECAEKRKILGIRKYV